MIWVYDTLPCTRYNLNWPNNNYIRNVSYLVTFLFGYRYSYIIFEWVSQEYGLQYELPVVWDNGKRMIKISGDTNYYYCITQITLHKFICSCDLLLYCNSPIHNWATWTGYLVIVCNTVLISYFSYLLACNCMPEPCHYNLVQVCLHVHAIWLHFTYSLGCFLMTPWTCMSRFRSSGRSGLFRWRLDFSCRLIRSAVALFFPVSFWSALEIPFCCS